jgi:hypothetical protein
MNAAAASECAPDIVAEMVHQMVKRQVEAWFDWMDRMLEFGLERVRQEWAVLRVDGTREVERARPPAERILRHVEEGFARAAARH